MDWLDKAEWLRANGYALNIYALDNTDGGEKWLADVEGEGSRYANTIQGAVEQVYDWVVQGWTDSVDSYKFTILSEMQAAINFRIAERRFVDRWVGKPFKQWLFKKRHKKEREEVTRLHYEMVYKAALKGE